MKRANTQDVANAIREWAKRNSDEEVHGNGCLYGIPDGPEDFYTECECEE